MCFADSIRKDLLARNKSIKKKEILKFVAVEWGKLSEGDRAHWDEVARDDKVRYVQQKQIVHRCLINIEGVVNYWTIFVLLKYHIVFI